MKSQIKPIKIKIEREQILRLFPEKKKISKTYIRALTTFITINQWPPITKSQHGLLNFQYHTPRD